MSISPGSLLGYNGQSPFCSGPPGHLNSAQKAKERKFKSVHEWVHGAIEMKTALQLNLSASVAFTCVQKGIYPVSTFRNFELIHRVNSLYSHLLLLRSGHILVNDGVIMMLVMTWEHLNLACILMQSDS